MFLNKIVHLTLYRVFAEYEVCQNYNYITPSDRNPVLTYWAVFLHVQEAVRDSCACCVVNDGETR